MSKNYTNDEKIDRVNEVLDEVLKCVFKYEFYLF
jgi:hypothetical protein